MKKWQFWTYCYILGHSSQTSGYDISDITCSSWREHRKWMCDLSISNRFLSFINLKINWKFDREIWFQGISKWTENIIQIDSKLCVHSNSVLYRWRVCGKQKCWFRFFSSNMFAFRCATFWNRNLWTFINKFELVYNYQFTLTLTHWKQ